MAHGYEMVKPYGLISGSEEIGKYSKRVNVMRWDGGAPKVDIRIWLPTGAPGRGITLNREELKRLKEILAEVEF